ncbi:MAG TPA: helix-turn-helix domain-containing protein [Gaiellaceae bacterium]|nr:helix-turn-helix domain-containing protein [Gaiellaceae bacterium]
MRCRRCEPVPEEVRRAAKLLERRWTVTILWAAHEGAVRFNEFRYACGRIPPRTLAERLADLEEAGVLERVVIDSRPPRVEYRLTERGRALRALVDALARWAQPHGVRATTESPRARG